MNQDFYILPSAARNMSRKPIIERLRSYEEYMRDVFTTIKRYAENGALVCVYTVPPSLPNVPLIPFVDVLAYITRQLRALKYDVRIPDKTRPDQLLISWYHPDVLRIESTTKPVSSSSSSSSASSSTTSKAKPRRYIPIRR